MFIFVVVVYPLFLSVFSVQPDCSCMAARLFVNPHSAVDDGANSLLVSPAFSPLLSFFICASSDRKQQESCALVTAQTDTQLMSTQTDSSPVPSDAQQNKAPSRNSCFLK